uniref:Aminoglycoside O-phosphotransferase APH(6)-Id n=1 Tax=Escherichia coli TaxID=562 RepID=A0A7D5KQJ9_ECOLX|nr:aminoglycoside O-phosphotransferase APH(6)-Id [Escherichia coli]
MPPVFPAHWHVSQPVLIADTFSSLVWKVSLPDGTPAIVKGFKPIQDIADELRGADYLVWRNGRGAVRLLGRENNRCCSNMPGSECSLTSLPSTATTRRPKLQRN